MLEEVQIMDVQETHWFLQMFVILQMEMGEMNHSDGDGNVLWRSSG